MFIVINITLTPHYVTFNSQLRITYNTLIAFSLIIMIIGAMGIILYFVAYEKLKTLINILAKLISPFT